MGIPMQRQVFRCSDNIARPAFALLTLPEADLSAFTPFGRDENAEIRTDNACVDVISVTGDLCQTTQVDRTADAAAGIQDCMIYYEQTDLRIRNRS